MALQDIRDTPAYDLVQEKKFVVTCSPETTLEEALEAMNEDEGFLGFVSVFDIMTYVAFTSHFKDETKDHSAPTFARLTNRVRDVLELSEENKSEMWKAYASDETLGSIAGRMESGIHRMLIAVDDRAKLLTQTDLVKFLYEKDKANPLMKQTVEEAGLGKIGEHKVQKITDSDTALQGFRTLYARQANAVPILDKDGAIVGTLSASDVRGLRANNTSDVLLPVLKFLEKHSAIRSQVSVTPTTKVEEVFRRLVEGRVHRVWLVDEKKQPVGVISMSDLIGLYFK